MRYLFFLILILTVVHGFAQDPIRGAGNRIRGMKGAMSGQGTDSLGKRNKNEDSITINYRYLDTARQYRIDSSITDFTRYPIPANYMHLGNTGSPARSILFSPSLISVTAVSKSRYCISRIWFIVKPAPSAPGIVFVSPSADWTFSTSPHVSESLSVISAIDSLNFPQMQILFKEILP